MRVYPLILGSATFICSVIAHAAVPLSNIELDDVTAGNASVPIQVDHITSKGTHIAVDGDVQWQTTTQNYNLILSDNAQQNLNSLININAVNSPVNVLLNLNINIDSAIGSIQQYNVNGAIPSQ
ncbi:MAG: hypothetical protein OEY89_07810 [Gammaproteobacteria bacterium]|nr:hypothetical protein [Gammaproteobacteria bacterium]